MTKATEKNLYTAPFDIRVEASHLHNAYHLGRVALATYVSEPRDDFPDVSVSFPRVIRLRGERLTGIVAGNDDNAVVAFRGTKEDQEWIQGLSSGQIEWPTGRVHGGIARALDGVWTQLLAAFYDVKAADRNLWITGHSIGGSVAILAAQRLHDEGFEPHFICTFGSPRVMDPHAAKAFKTPAYRFVNNEDFIPDVPWPSFFDEYEHVGERVFLLPSGAIAEKRHSPELARRIDRANTIGEGILPSGMFHDHGLRKYLKKLSRHA